MSHSREKKMPKKHRSDALAAIHETAADLHRVGGTDEKTMRKFDALCRTRIKAGPHGYLIIAGTGDVLTPEMVKESSEDELV
jgi:ATP-dependent protease HslVU (ClpYQ) peptidase subunit